MGTISKDRQWITETAAVLVVTWSAVVGWWVCSMPVDTSIRAKPRFINLTQYRVHAQGD